MDSIEEQEALVKEAQRVEANKKALLSKAEKPDITEIEEASLTEIAEFCRKATPSLIKHAIEEAKASNKVNDIMSVLREIAAWGYGKELADRKANEKPVSVNIVIGDRVMGAEIKHVEDTSDGTDI